MSGFFNSIIRGAGMTIGRNIVGNLGSSNKSKMTSHRYYDRAENEFEKAINFEIKGRSDTVLGNCFNLYKEFENECESSYYSVSLALLLRGSKMKYYNESLEKIKDCNEYISLKNPTDPNIEKLETIRCNINKTFSNYINRLSQSIPLITKSKDKETARHAWYGYKGSTTSPLKDLYNQTSPNSPMVAEIENHIKSFWDKVFKK
jgi:hypothetical protein